MKAIALSFIQFYIFGKSFGVFPYAFDFRSKQFKRSFLAQLHTIVILGLSALAYPMLISAFIERVDSNHKNEAVGSRITILYRYVDFGLTMILSLQLCYQNRIVELLNNGHQISRKVLQQTPESYFRKFYYLHLAQLTMAVIWWLMLVSLLLNYFPNPNLLDIVYCFAVTLPVMAMTSMSGAFVLCLGLIMGCYSQIGQQIKMLPSKLQLQPVNHYESLTKQCQLSDELDVSMVYFRRLNEILRTLVQVLSVPLYFFISISFTGAMRGVSTE
jgi:ABC-type multidrug transport system fused ATPase/permease subunit